MDGTDSCNSRNAGPKLRAGRDKTGVRVSGAERPSILCRFTHQNRTIETMDTHTQAHTHLQ